MGFINIMLLRPKWLIYLIYIKARVYGVDDLIKILLI